MRVRRFKSVLFVVALVAGTLAAAAPSTAGGGGDAVPVGIDSDRIDEAIDELGLHTPWRAALEEAIDPNDYECGPTAFDTWIGGVLDATNLDAFFFLVFELGVDIWPTVYKALFDVDGSDEFIGEDGAYTREQFKRHKDNRRFWDVNSDDILLQGMHGSDIADDAKMVPTVAWLFEVDPAIAQEAVDLAQLIIASEPTLGFDHPLWSLNAFAFSADGDVIPGVGTPPDTIVMGDGLLEALEGMGLAQHGPDFVHAHEFAHHVQFELDVFEVGEPTPEGTRRTELMADAFGAYFAAHPRGMSMQTQRILEVVEAAFVVGDCGFDSPGHHGTPNQRAAAAEWGDDLANSARGKGKIESASTMVELFDAHLPVLVLPDA